MEFNPATPRFNMIWYVPGGGTAMSAAVTGSGGDVVLVFLFLARVDPLLFLLLDVVVDFLFSAMVFDVVDGDATWCVALLRFETLAMCPQQIRTLPSLSNTPQKNSQNSTDSENKQILNTFS